LQSSITSLASTIEKGYGEMHKHAMDLEKQWHTEQMKVVKEEEVRTIDGSAQDWIIFARQTRDSFLLQRWHRCRRYCYGMVFGLAVQCVRIDSNDDTKDGVAVYCLHCARRCRLCDANCLLPGAAVGHCLRAAYGSAVHVLGGMLPLIVPPL
jgi:hypothetical protein